MVLKLVHYHLSILINRLSTLANHTAYSNTGSNHATLINGSATNSGSQNEFHPLLFQGFSRANNRLLQSENITVSPWTALGITRAANVTTDPIGGNTADSITEDSSSGEHRLRFSITVTGGTETFSVYVRPNGRNFFVFRVLTPGGTLSASYNLVTNSVNEVGNFVSASIVDAGGGWRRCIATFENRNNNGLFLHIARATQAFVYQGDGTSGLYIWGAQFVTGLSFPYYPTTTTAINAFVPKHATNNTDVLGNPLTHTQDGESFLDCGTQYSPLRVPALVQGDFNNALFGANVVPNEIDFAGLEFNQIGSYGGRIFADNSDVSNGIIKQFTVYQNELVRRQLATEESVKNTVGGPRATQLFPYPVTARQNSAITSNSVTVLDNRIDYFRVEYRTEDVRAIEWQIRPSMNPPVSFTTGDQIRLSGEVRYTEDEINNLGVSVRTSFAGTRQTNTFSVGPATSPNIWHSFVVTLTYVTDTTLVNASFQFTTRAEDNTNETIEVRNLDIRRL